MLIFKSLVLGLPAGSSNDDFGPDETFSNPKVDKDSLFMRKLCDLSGGIIQRNQSPNSVAYATTQEIDEKLDSLAKEMTQSWWEIPTTPNNIKSAEAAMAFDKVMVQIWYFQLELLVHLPFMLRAATERRYEYSKFSCLKAAREMIYRYLSMQNDGRRSFCCKVMDFGALTSTVTLLLGILQASQVPETAEVRAQKESDRALAHTVLKALEHVSQGGKEVIAAQSVTVIRSLLAMDSPTSAQDTGNLRLTIPYFGTISIVRPSRTRPPIIPNQSSKTPSMQPKHNSVAFPDVPEAGIIESGWATIPYQTPSQEAFGGGSNVPMVSFTSSHFPPVMQLEGGGGHQGAMPYADWNLMEADTMFFDSLLSSDSDGNWIL